MSHRDHTESEENWRRKVYINTNKSKYSRSVSSVRRRKIVVVWCCGANMLVNFSWELKSNKEMLSWYLKNSVPTLPALHVRSPRTAALWDSNFLFSRSRSQSRFSFIDITTRLTCIRQMSMVFFIYFPSNNSRLVWLKNLRIGFSDTFVMSLGSLSTNSTSSTSLATPYTDLLSGLFIRWMFCKIFSVSPVMPWPNERQTWKFMKTFTQKTQNTEIFHTFEKVNLGLSGRKARMTAQIKLGRPQSSRYIRHGLYSISNSGMLNRNVSLSSR